MIAYASTDFKTAQLIIEISNLFDKDIFSLGVFIDLSRPFETVHHKTLITEMTEAS